MNTTPTVSTLMFRVSYLFSTLGPALLSEMYEHGACLWLDAEEVELFLTTASDPRGYPQEDTLVSVQIQLDRHEGDSRIDEGGSTLAATSPPDADWIRRQLMSRANECANALHVELEAAESTAASKAEATALTESKDDATAIANLTSSAACLFKTLSAPVLVEVYEGGARLWFDAEHDEMFLTTASDPRGYPRGADLFSVEIELERHGTHTRLGGDVAACDERAVFTADWVRLQLICRAAECANALYFEVEAAEAA